MQMSLHAALTPLPHPFSDCCWSSSGGWTWSSHGPWPLKCHAGTAVHLCPHYICGYTMPVKHPVLLPDRTSWCFSPVPSRISPSNGTNQSTVGHIPQPRGAEKHLPDGISHLHAPSSSGCPLGRWRVKSRAYFSSQGSNCKGLNCWPQPNSLGWWAPRRRAHVANLCCTLTWLCGLRLCH